MSLQSVTYTAAVSASIRKSGIIRPLPSGTPAGRRGVRVSRSLFHVNVEIDLGTRSETKAAAEEITGALIEDGWAVADGDTLDEPGIYVRWIHVTKKDQEG